jgi:hypothetical protein
MLPIFPILRDELRDYRFYATDMQHPSKQAAQIIYDRFLTAALLHLKTALNNLRAQYKLVGIWQNF